MKTSYLVTGLIIGLILYMVYLCMPVKHHIIINDFKKQRICDTLFSQSKLMSNFHYVKIKGYVNDTIWYRFKDIDNKRFLIHDINVIYSEGEHYNRQYGPLELNTYKATQGHLEVEHIISTF